MLKRCGLISAFLILPVLAFCAEDKALDLEPIVVTKPRIAAASHFVIEPSVISHSPVESLKLLPVDLQSRSLKGGIQTDFSLRAAGFQGALLLLNGQRINDPQTAHHNCDIPFTREDIASVELISGTGSVLFGPDGIGGALNFKAKEPQANQAILELRAGEYSSGSGLLSISRKKGDLGLRLSLENEECAGFDEDTDYKKFTVALASSLNFSEGNFDLHWGYQEKEFGAFDFYTPGLGYPSKEWTKTYLLNCRLNLNKGGLLLRPTFLWRRHYDKFMLDKTLIRSRYLNHHRSDIYTPAVYFQKDTPALGEIGLGLEYGQERISSTNLGKHSREHKSILLAENKDLNEAFSLNAAWRADDFTYFGRADSGNLRLNYKASVRLELNAGLSRNIRLPSFTELYYSDPTTLGDPHLSQEEAMNYEAGYTYRQADFSWGTNFFFRKEKKMIDWVKHEATQPRWQAENLASAKVFGLENHLKFKITPYLGLDANYTYLDKPEPRAAYLYKYGPNYSRHLVNLSLNLDLPFGTQVLELSYKKKPQRSGRLLLNPRFSYRFSKKYLVFLAIDNLLDVEYQEIVGIPQPGRWIEAGCRMEW